MLISLKHGFVFLCMPKSASNSIEAMLRPYCEIHLRGSPQVRHTNVREWEAYVRPYLAEVAGIAGLETICVLREPLAWLASWYRFRARYDLRSTGHPHCTAHVSFCQFVEAYTLDARPPYADVGSQFDFVRRGNGTVGVDKLFAYQRLGDLVDYFSARVGRRLRLKTLNVSPRTVQRAAILERADSWRRRAVGSWRLGPASTRPEQPLPALPEALRRRLESRICRDFEIYRDLEMPHANN